jgi:hypothetical protein
LFSQTRELKLICSKKQQAPSVKTRHESSGPEGIRTPDLLSAIEARSQLRYRPVCKAKGILTEAEVYVKQFSAIPLVIRRMEILGGEFLDLACRKLISL